MLQHTATPMKFSEKKLQVILSLVTATHCNTMQYAVIHCNTLQHTIAHCNTLQHAAAHCNKLKHAATCSNTHGVS